jgi:hypothetical protein
MGIRWSKFSLQGEEETASRLGPFIFPEIMSRTDSFLTRDTRRGAVASFYVYINFSGESRTWTCAYRTVSSYLTCPSITSGPSIDILRAEESHRCFNRQPPIPVAFAKNDIESCYHLPSRHKLTGWLREELDAEDLPSLPINRDNRSQARRAS